MAKKKMAAGGLVEGTRIRVKAGVVSPEFPDISIAGWTGEVSETVGKPPQLSYLVKWDAATIAAMPQDYVERCEAQQLFHPMASLPDADVEPVA
jgi:hypothetical protein